MVLRMRLLRFNGTQDVVLRESQRAMNQARVRLQCGNRVMVVDVADPDNTRNVDELVARAWLSLSQRDLMRITGGVRFGEVLYKHNFPESAPIPPELIEL